MQKAAQMEFGLGRQGGRSQVRRKAPEADWWFRRMRAVVDGAVEWGGERKERGLDFAIRRGLS